MGFIYYIYESNKKSGHQAYIGKTEEDNIDIRLGSHIRATFHNGKDPITGFDSNPAVNILAPKGISNCIFGYFTEDENVYGIGQDTVDAFVDLGWKINSYLGFAEICHILVQRGPQALSNINEGGSTGSIVFDFTTNQSINDFLTKYGVIKKLQQVGYKPWVKAHPVDRLLHPIKYGGEKIIKDLLTRILVKDTDLWLKITKQALLHNWQACEQIIKTASHDVINDFNTAFKGELSVKLNTSQLAKDICKWMNDRIAMPSIQDITNKAVQFLQASLGKVKVTATAKNNKTTINTATEKDIKGTTKITKTNVQSFNLMLDDALTFNYSNVAPLWLQLARKNIRVPSNNTLTNSNLQTIVKKNCADEFARIINKVIETPQTGSEAIQHKLLFNGETVIGYKGSDVYTDTLSNRVKQEYLKIFPSSTPVIGQWILFFREQYAYWRKQTNRNKLAEWRTDRDKIVVSSASPSKTHFVYYRKKKLMVQILNQEEINSLAALSWNYL